MYHRHLTGRRGPARALVAVLIATMAMVGGLSSSAQAAVQRIVLRVLVVSSNDAATAAIVTELDRQAIPYTTVVLGAPGRPTIDEAFLVDTAAGAARFQAVVLPNQAGGGLATAELDALAAYETSYGIRQVNGYDWPNPAMGLGFPTYAGPLDGATATVTATGLAGPFGYLKGSLAIDDLDPAVFESYGYLATADPNLAAGRTFTPLVTATRGSDSGVLAGVFAHDGREELVLPVSFNAYMQWFNAMAPGIVDWMTRGIHLGYQRNYLNVHIDDVLNSDSRWSVTGNCTPGGDCLDPALTSAEIRMTPADVTRLVAWQNARGISLDMVFNAYGTDIVKATNGSDPLTDAMLANKSAWRWVNHTYSHQYLGCIRIAPTAAGQTWHCATSPTESPRVDPDITQDLSGGVYWASRAQIDSELAKNTAWATQNALPNFDRSELVTGEHSGLASLPQMTADNPFLAPALAAAGIKYAGSDASREPNVRVLAGGATSTVPRHPMNIYYNAATFQELIDEYNWIYTTKAQGGSGLCENNPASTCITPLPAANAAEARASFDSYLTPLEVRNALKFVLTHDPRPFYAHQSNLAEDGLLYPVLDGVISTYASIYDTAKAPLQQTGLTGQYQALQRIDTWRASGATVDGYLDSTGVHVPDAGVAVPVTVPAGSSGNGLSPYAGALSGWFTGATTITPSIPNGGYLVGQTLTAPGAPAGVVASPGSTLATVTWTAPATDGGSPITGYRVRAFAGTSTTAVQTIQAPADAVNAVVTGLTNGTSYRFDVAAVNAVGTGAATASAAVTPLASLAPVPGIPAVTGGNAALLATWTAPAATTGITGYRVRVYRGTTLTKTVTVPAGRLSTTVTGLSNGTAYTVDVASVTGTSTGAASARSASVAPSLTAQLPTAPSLSSVAPLSGSIQVTWQPAADASLGTPSGYRVRVFSGSTGTSVAKTVSVAATATSATVTGLLNGLGYSAEVNATYASGAGPSSARSVSVVPKYSVPSAPVIGAASSGTAGGSVNATARWSPPAGNGGFSILGYYVTAYRVAADGTVTRTSTSGLQGSGARSYTMSLTAGSYYFTVAAANLLGRGVESVPSNVVTAQ